MSYDVLPLFLFSGKNFGELRYFLFQCLVEFTSEPFGTGNLFLKRLLFNILNKYKFIQMSIASCMSFYKLCLSKN